MVAAALRRICTQFYLIIAATCALLVFPVFVRNQLRRCHRWLKHLSSPSCDMDFGGAGVDLKRECARSDFTPPHHQSKRKKHGKNIITNKEQRGGHDHHNHLNRCKAPGKPSSTTFASTPLPVTCARYVKNVASVFCLSYWDTKKKATTLIASVPPPTSPKYSTDFRGLRTLCDAAGCSSVVAPANYDDSPLMKLRSSI